MKAIPFYLSLFLALGAIAQADIKVYVLDGGTLIGVIPEDSDLRMKR